MRPNFTEQSEHKFTGRIYPASLIYVKEALKGAGSNSHYDLCSLVFHKSCAHKKEVKNGTYRRA